MSCKHEHRTAYLDRDSKERETCNKCGADWPIAEPGITGNVASAAPTPAHDDAPVLDPADPIGTAREIVGREYTLNGQAVLVHHAGDFRAHDGAAYRAVDDASMRARAWTFLEKAKRIEHRDGAEIRKRFQPTKGKVDNVLDALKAVTNLPASITPPAWIDGREHPPGEEFLTFPNGLLHLPTMTRHDPTPAFFTLNALDFHYDPSAGEPSRWLRFLSELWPDDQTAIDALQEIFGYLLTTDTSQEKIFLLCGPKRAGKGVILRILRRLLGEANVCGPTLSGLSQNFGLESLIGAQAAIIADARLSGRADQAVIAERLLSISGEDALSIPRKHRPDWNGKLSTRFIVATNELPRLADASGALASRFIVLTLERSFYGREDTKLTDRLIDELPGILNWAIAGWQRLNKRGHFVQPQSSAEAIEELEALGSPIGAFVRDRCIVEAGRSIETQALYGAWCEWCRSEGREHPGTAQSFGRDLKAAAQGVRSSNPRRVNGSRLRFYENIDLDPTAFTVPL